MANIADEVSESDTPIYGMEALIGTIRDKKELLRELRKLSRYNATFGRKAKAREVR